MHQMHKMHKIKKQSIIKNMKLNKYINSFDIA